MTKDNLTVIPTWKDGPTLTAADRLHELALLAQTQPHKFDRFVLVRLGHLANGNLEFDHYQFGCDLPQQIGLFAIGQAQAIEESRA
jgi:hypothetical protein